MPLYCKILKKNLENVRLLPNVLEYALRDKFPSFRVSEAQGHFLDTRSK